MRHSAVICITLALTACATPPAAPGPGSWQQLRPLPYERFEAAAANLDGKVYYFGGITDRCSTGDAACPVADVDVYDPTTEEWTPAPPLPDAAPRHHLAVTVLDHQVWVLGGFTGIIGGAQQFEPVPTTWSFDGMSWQRHADQPIARGSATAQAIGTLLYVAGGGTQEPDSLAALYSYDPAADQWSLLPAMPTAREHVASCTLDGKLLVVGGWAGPGKNAVSAAELFDPVAGVWQVLPDLPTARGGLAAGVLEGRCHVLGGEDWALPPPGTFADNQAWDPSTQTWMTFAPLPHARHGIGLAVVSDTFYVVGGGPTQGNSYTTELDLFLPSR